MNWRFWVSKKPKISVEVSEESRARYVEHAERAGVDLSKWVRTTLDAASAPVETGSAAAFAALDRIDAGESPAPVQALESVPAPTPPPPPQGFSATLPTGPGLWPGHPCQFSRTNPTGRTCAHSDKNGQSCAWSAPIADQCPLFVKRRVA